LYESDPIKQKKSLTVAIVKRTINTVPDHIFIASSLPICIHAYHKDCCYSEWKC